MHTASQGLKGPFKSFKAWKTTTMKLKKQPRVQFEANNWPNSSMNEQRVFGAKMVTN